MKKPKRFVAGALCPNCNEKDRIRIWVEGSVTFRDCVSCDFYERATVKPSADKWSSEDKLISIADATGS